jgi:phage shock protein E
MRLLILLLLSSCAIFQSEKTLTPKPVVKRQKPATPVKAIDSKALEALQKKLSQKNVVLIDVRTPEEYVNGHVKGAKNLNFMDESFQAQVATLDKNKRYYLYCASGNRSGKAMQYFHARKIKAESIETYDQMKDLGITVEGLSP